MEWLNIHISTLRSPEFIGSNPTERATWLCVLGYSVEQENGGRIVGAANWKDRQWQQACGVTLREIRSADKLLRFLGDDLWVNGYPLDKQAEVQAKRVGGTYAGRAITDAKARAARENGRLGGRPKTQGETQDETHETQAEEPTKPKLNPREGKGREGEGEGKAPPKPTAPRPIEILAKALRRRGLSSAPQAVEEWADFLQGSCRIKTTDEGQRALDLILEHAKRDGVAVIYSKHAAAYAESVARILRNERKLQEPERVVGVEIAEGVTA